MNRVKALKTPLVLFGLLFLAAAYPIVRYLWRPVFGAVQRKKTIREGAAETRQPRSKVQVYMVRTTRNWAWPLIMRAYASAALSSG